MVPGHRGSWPVEVRQPANQLHGHSRPIGPAHQDAGHTLPLVLCRRHPPPGEQRCERGRRPLRLEPGQGLGLLLRRRVGAQALEPDPDLVFGRTHCSRAYGRPVRLRLSPVAAEQASKAYTPSHLATAPDDRVRAFSAEALGKARDRAVAPALLQALRDVSSEVRRAATLCLASLDETTPFSLLEDLYRSEQPGQRAEVLAAMANLDDARADRFLLEALETPSVATRRAAVVGLARRDGPAVRPALERALADEHHAVRLAAVAGLVARPDGRESVPALVATLSRHEGYAELQRIHEALELLTGHDLEGPTPSQESWPPVIEAWNRYLAEGGR